MNILVEKELELNRIEARKEVLINEINETKKNKDANVLATYLHDIECSYCDGVDKCSFHDKNSDYYIKFYSRAHKLLNITTLENVIDITKILLF